MQQNATLLQELVLGANNRLYNGKKLIMVFVTFPTYFFIDRMRRSALLCLSFLLAGCTSNVQVLHDLNPPANDFPSALASEYQSYADSEAEQGRSSSAEHFAGKGLKSLKGEAVEPDAVSDALPAKSQQELIEARAQLIRVLTDDVKRVTPQQAARAQLLLDCWQNELIRNINQELAPCADEYRSTAQQLQDVADPLIYGKTIRRTLSFAAKETKLDEANLEIIKTLAKEVSLLPHYHIQLDAYRGIKVSQRKLSEARVAAVRRELIKEGVNEHRIHIRKGSSAKAVVLRNKHIAVDTKKVTITVKIRKQPKGGA